MDLPIIAGKLVRKNIPKRKPHIPLGYIIAHLKFMHQEHRIKERRIVAVKVIPEKPREVNGRGVRERKIANEKVQENTNLGISAKNKPILFLDISRLIIIIPQLIISICTWSFYSNPLVIHSFNASTKQTKHSQF